MTGADTIFALSSGRPPAAIAIIRITGCDALRAGKRLAGALPGPRQAGLRKLVAADGRLLDEALVLSFVGTGTSTGEDLVELHCHGGRAVIDAVLGELGSMPGLRLAEPGEFTRRAFANGRLDLTEAEGLSDLLQAETEAQRRSALLMANGAVRRQIEDWRERLLALSAQAEAAIDYVDEEDETACDAERLARSAGVLAGEMAGWLAQPRAEPLKQGVRVVFAGPANAGKSSLLNTLAGEDKAIVTPIAGTTRDVIEVPLRIEGTPFLLIDTAGLRESEDPVEQAGVKRARQQIDTADILLWLGEPDEAPRHGCTLLIHAQSDRTDRDKAPAGSFAVSAVTGQGIEQLRSELVSRALALLPAHDAVALNARQAAFLGQAAESLRLVSATDIVLAAEALRTARYAMDRITGRAGVEDMLDAVFANFCLGK